MYNNSNNLTQLLNSLGGINNLMNQYQSWQNNFYGNAEQEIRNMLNNGRITQQQFNDVARLAQMIQNMRGYNNNI